MTLEMPEEGKASFGLKKLRLSCDIQLDPDDGVFDEANQMIASFQYQFIVLDYSHCIQREVIR